MVVENNEISVQLENGEINLVSSSKDFITVESISLYYSGLISTRANLNLGLSPESKLLPKNKLNLKRDFDIDWSVLTFRRRTNKQARGIKIKYGFAIKYKKSSDHNMKTLFKTNPYCLSDLSN